MAPKKKSGARGARGAGPGPPPSRPLPGQAAADPGIDIVFDKPKPKTRGHRQRYDTTVLLLYCKGGARTINVA